MGRALGTLMLVVGTASHAAAQPTSLSFRTTSGRARMELALDSGYGFGTEGDYAELAADFRVYTPEGTGAVFRAGGALRVLSNAMAFDLGAAQRFELVGGTNAGLQLALVAGTSMAWGPFDPEGNVAAYGGFGMVHLDVWTTNFFIGLGVTGHAMLPARHHQGGRSDPILTIAPQIRLGGDWGL